MLMEIVLFFSIQPTDLTSYKNEKVIKTNDYFLSRYEEIKESIKS